MYRQSYSEIMDMTMIQEKLLDFNSDQSTQMIRDFYTKKSFLEIM